MSQTNPDSLAAIFHQPSQPLTLERFALPTLNPGELLARVTCSTLCGSDVHTYLGHRSTPVPTILGHEILGVIEQVAPGTTICDYHGAPLGPGDRITWSIAASCGGCFYCAQEVPQKCERLFKYGHEAVVADHPLSGGLAEHCHLARGTAILRVPDSLPDVVACPANCATATVAAALRVGGSCTDQTVLIQGAGMLGLTAAAMARCRGARKVIVCDVSDDRLARASAFGASHCLPITGSASDLTEQVQGLTGGRGVDLAIELSGAADAVRVGLGLPRIGGRYVLIGSTRPSPPIDFDPESIVRRCLTIVGNHNYRPDDLAAAIDFLRDDGDEFPFAELVHDEFLLPDANAAIARACTGDDLRVAVRPEG